MTKKDFKELRDNLFDHFDFLVKEEIEYREREKIIEITLPTSKDDDAVTMKMKGGKPHVTVGLCDCRSYTFFNFDMSFSKVLGLTSSDSGLDCHGLINLYRKMIRQIEDEVKYVQSIIDEGPTEEGEDEKSP